MFVFACVRCTFGCYNAFKAVGEEKVKAIECALEALDFLEKQIKGEKVFDGEQMGFMDLMVVWIPQWLCVFDKSRTHEATCCRKSSFSI